METVGDILIERLKLLAGCKNYAELASYLNVGHGLLSRARREGRLPEELRKSLVNRGINPHWVEREAGGKYLTGEEKTENLAVLREEPLHYVLQRALREFAQTDAETDKKLMQ